MYPILCAYPRTTTSSAHPGTPHPASRKLFVRAAPARISLPSALPPPPSVAVTVLDAQGTDPVEDTMRGGKTRVVLQVDTLASLDDKLNAFFTRSVRGQAGMQGRPVGGGWPLPPHAVMHGSVFGCTVWCGWRRKWPQAGEAAHRVPGSTMSFVRKLVGMNESWEPTALAPLCSGGRSDRSIVHSSI
eukprot:GHVU01151991.1.p1 GENE.GHVU01151991.1~~GHVU01151991.1.p1  ORF type:complete len:187 (-),score=7.90 GHVU01151991.1:12-572(-)